MTAPGEGDQQHDAPAKTPPAGQKRPPVARGEPMAGDAAVWSIHRESGDAARRTSQVRGGEPPPATKKNPHIEREEAQENDVRRKVYTDLSRGRYPTYTFAPEQISPELTKKLSDAIARQRPGVEIAALTSDHEEGNLRAEIEICFDPSFVTLDFDEQKRELFGTGHYQTEWHPTTPFPRYVDGRISTNGTAIAYSIEGPSPRMVKATYRDGKTEWWRVKQVNDEQVSVGPYVGKVWKADDRAARMEHISLPESLTFVVIRDYLIPELRSLENDPHYQRVLQGRVPAVAMAIDRLLRDESEKKGGIFKIYRTSNGIMIAHIPSGMRGETVKQPAEPEWRHLRAMLVDEEVLNQEGKGLSPLEVGVKLNAPRAQIDPSPELRWLGARWHAPSSNFEQTPWRRYIGTRMCDLFGLRERAAENPPVREEIAVFPLNRFQESPLDTPAIQEKLSNRFQAVTRRRVVRSETPSPAFVIRRLPAGTNLRVITLSTPPRPTTGAPDKKSARFEHEQRLETTREAVDYVRVPRDGGNGEWGWMRISQTDEGEVTLSKPEREMLEKSGENPEAFVVPTNEKEKVLRRRLEELGGDDFYRRILGSEQAVERIVEGLRRYFSEIRPGKDRRYDLLKSQKRIYLLASETVRGEERQIRIDLTRLLEDENVIAHLQKSGETQMTATDWTALEAVKGSHVFEHTGISQVPPINAWLRDKNNILTPERRLLWARLMGIADDAGVGAFLEWKKKDKSPPMKPAFFSLEPEHPASPGVAQG